MDKSTKDAVYDVLNEAIDRSNHGAMSRYQASYRSVSLLREMGIVVDYAGGRVVQGGVPVYRIRERTAAAKRHGMYKTLGADLVSLREGVPDILARGRGPDR